MKFKYLSSDFLASYNELMDQLDEKQALLDTEYQERVEKIISLEKERLEKLVPENFSPGEEVKIHGSNKTGKVISSHINFNVMLKEEEDAYGSPLYGPGKYFPIKSFVDEEVVTCEGVLRSYLVERALNSIEEDWGVESVSSSYYEDELEKTES